MMHFSNFVSDLETLMEKFVDNPRAKNRLIYFFYGLQCGRIESFPMEKVYEILDAKEKLLSTKHLTQKD